MTHSEKLFPWQNLADVLRAEGLNDPSALEDACYWLWDNERKFRVDAPNTLSWECRVVKFDEIIGEVIPGAVFDPSDYADSERVLRRPKPARFEVPTLTLREIARDGSSLYEGALSADPIHITTGLAVMPWTRGPVELYRRHVMLLQTDRKGLIEALKGNIDSEPSKSAPTIYDFVFACFEASGEPVESLNLKSSSFWKLLTRNVGLRAFGNKGKIVQTWKDKKHKDDKKLCGSNVPGILVAFSIYRGDFDASRLSSCRKEKFSLDDATAGRMAEALVGFVKAKTSLAFPPDRLKAMLLQAKSDDVWKI